MLCHHVTDAAAAAPSPSLPFFWSRGFNCVSLMSPRASLPCEAARCSATTIKWRRENRKAGRAWEKKVDALTGDS
jgi:hypothetical protein